MHAVMQPVRYSLPDFFKRKFERAAEFQQNSSHLLKTRYAVLRFLHGGRRDRQTRVFTTWELAENRWGGESLRSLSQPNNSHTFMDPKRYYGIQERATISCASWIQSTPLTPWPLHASLNYLLNHTCLPRDLIPTTCGGMEFISSIHPTYSVPPQVKLLSPMNARFNVYRNQRDAQILVNSLYCFIKWLYMFRTVISPSWGATFYKFYRHECTGTTYKMLLLMMD